MESNSLPPQTIERVARNSIRHGKTYEVLTQGSVLLHKYGMLSEYLNSLNIPFYLPNPLTRSIGDSRGSVE